MNTSGVILAGGKSSRMKFNKAFAEISGRPVINIIVDKFVALFDEIIIISNEPGLYVHLGVPVYTDVYPHMGPVAGIHSALYHCRHDSAFVMGCDVPFMNMDLVRMMISRLNGYDSVVPRLDNQLQPLAAVYSRRCLPVLTNCLQTNRVKLIRIFDELNALEITRSEIEQFGVAEEMFLNVNDIEALNLAAQIAGRS
ncbi:MAG: molybdenum cofactor guanylyltransferase [Syntrophomonadaceae bacterium]